MYYDYGKFNPFHSGYPLYSGWLLLGGSVMRSSTVLLLAMPWTCSDIIDTN